MFALAAGGHNQHWNLYPKHTLNHNRSNTQRRTHNQPHSLMQEQQHPRMQKQLHPRMQEQPRNHQHTSPSCC
jgi:hypothetical protein